MPTTISGHIPTNQKTIAPMGSAQKHVANTATSNEEYRQ